MEGHLFIFLIEVVLLLGLARVLGELFRKAGQPAIVGEILVGIILGPTILGRFLPDVHQYIFPADPLQVNMINTLAWLGILMLLLATGLEVDVSTAWRQRGPALKIAVIGVFLPLVIGFLFALVLPGHYLVGTDRLIFSLFLGTAIAISAITVISRLLHDLDLLKTDLGLLILSAFAVNDLLGWIIFTVVLGMASVKRVDVGMIAIVFLATVVLASVALTIGRRFVSGVISRLKGSYPTQPGIILTFIFCLALVVGSISQVIGIHAIFGFFLAGIMVGEARGLSERTRQTINQMVYAILVPIFFASIGLRIDFALNFDFFLVIAITVLAISGKLIGAWFGTFGAGISSEDRYAIAIAHIPGGAMEIVVAVVALQFGLISPKIFVAIVFAAMLSTLLVGPWFLWAIKRRKIVNVLDFFLRRAVIADLKSDERFEALMEIADKVAEQERMPESKVVYDAVMDREQLMGTGLEKGIAVPHGRVPGIIRPVFTLVRSKEGIDWDSPDGEPAHLIFLLLTPLKEEGAQVQILGKIARVMSKAKNRKRILRAKGEEEMVNAVQELMRSEGTVIKR